MVRAACLEQAAKKRLVWNKQLKGNKQLKILRVYDIMKSINSMPLASPITYISIDILESDDESKEVITTGDWAIGVVGCVGVIIVLTGVTIGLLYAGGLL